MIGLCAERALASELHAHGSVLGAELAEVILEFILNNQVHDGLVSDSRL